MKKIIKSFGYAFSGLAYAFRTQLNFKIHFSVLLLVTVAGYFYKLSAGEWSSIVAVSALVLVTELINTAIETLTDLASPGYHEKAKIVKDVAAAAVVISCIAAVITGLVIFIPRIC